MPPARGPLAPARGAGAGPTVAWVSGRHTSWSGSGSPQEALNVLGVLPGSGGGWRGPQGRLGGSLRALSRAGRVWSLSASMAPMVSWPWPSWCAAASSAGVTGLIESRK